VASRTFFRDCQVWEWIPRRFDPARALALPRSAAALISTSPRVVADVWAKLLWAGLNLEPADPPGKSADSYYPMLLIRAVTLTWLFSGLRSNELSRLRVGCVRWQHEGAPTTVDAPDVAAADAVCLLDVPVHKTGVACNKPVDPLVGQAIEAWQAARPAQPSTIDYPVELVASTYRAATFCLVDRMKNALDCASHGLHRAGGDDALWSAANPEKKVDAGSFPSCSYGGGDVTIREHRVRAPVARTSAISCWCRGRLRMQTVTSVGRPPIARATALTFASTGAVISTT
jgi:hypothetical protein